MAKPASKPDWTITNPDQATISVEPTGSKKNIGWLADERPPHQFWNWLLLNITEWINYFETITDGMITQLDQYDAKVGFGGTHENINTLMADPDIANFKNILVTGNILVDAVQVIDQPDMTFTFKPQVHLTKGMAVSGIQIDAERVRIKGARFLNFTGEAIELTVNAKNCLIAECLFKNNTVTINDLGENNLLVNNIEEV